ncbi:type I restriction enzyme specificity subunit [Salinisphaera sp. C84B14]|uniref:restriction endonuclease subunit S n=1 Tax=Salinisphaera sp. C84B14 TaxID=1304155 RepID=UPI0033415FD4
MSELATQASASDWEKIELREVLTLNYGKALPKARRNPSGQIPVYGANGIKDYADQALSNGPTLIIGRKGSAGQITRVDGDFWPLDVTYFTSHDQNRIDFDYLAYALSMLDLPSLARGVKPGINRNDVYALEILMPSTLEEQKRIVAVLDQAFAALDRARARAEKSLNDGKQLYHTALDRLFLSANQWANPVIKEFAEVFDGPHATPKTVDSGPLFLGISSLVDGRIELGKTRHVTESDFQKWTKRVTPEPGDVVFAYETRLGQIALIPEGMRCCLGRRMGLVRLDKKKVLPEYFVIAYISPAYQEFLKSKIVEGATVDRIHLRDFPKFPFPVPPIEEQQEIIERAHRIRAQSGKLNALIADKLEMTSELRRSLLQKAFAGNLV